MNTKPDFISSNGTKFYELNGKLHRIEYPNGRKEWYLNGKLHREDGPAIENADGNNKWYLNDRQLTEEEWQLKTLKIFDDVFPLLTQW